MAESALRLLRRVFDIGEAKQFRQEFESRRRNLETDIDAVDSPLSEESHTVETPQRIYAIGFRDGVLLRESEGVGDALCAFESLEEAKQAAAQMAALNSPDDRPFIVKYVRAPESREKNINDIQDVLRELLFCGPSGLEQRTANRMWLTVLQYCFPEMAANVLERITSHNSKGRPKQ